MTTKQKSREENSETLCPNCQSREKWIEDRIIEKDEGFYVCGMCKGKGWVFTRNDSYSTIKYNWFGRRTGMDVVRIVGLEQEEPDFDYDKFARQQNTKFLGFTKIFKTIAQNDIS